MVKYRVKITDIIEEAQGTKTFLLEKPDDFTWTEGAHTHIGLLGFDEGETPNKNLVRHMSIMTLPEENILGFTTRITPNPSEFKEKLTRLPIGDEVILFKIGSRMFLRRVDKPVVLVSMGVGIATMRPLIHGFIKDKTGISNLININIDSSKDYVFREELDKLVCADYKNYWLGSRKEFYERLDQIAKSSTSIYYVVGGDTFIVDVIKLLKNNNINEHCILIDKKEELIASYFN